MFKITEHPGSSVILLSIQDREGCWIWMSHQVRFMNPGESFNRGTIESHSTLERHLEFTGGYGKTLDLPKNIGEPESNYGYILFTNLFKNRFLL